MERWFCRGAGPYTIIEVTKKGFYKLQYNSTSVLLKSAVGGSMRKAANLPDEMSENADQNSYQFEDGLDQNNFLKSNTTILTTSGNANKDSWPPWPRPFQPGQKVSPAYRKCECFVILTEAIWIKVRSAAMVGGTPCRGP